MEGFWRRHNSVRDALAKKGMAPKRRFSIWSLSRVRGRLLPNALFSEAASQLLYHVSRDHRGRWRALDWAKRTCRAVATNTSRPHLLPASALTKAAAILDPLPPPLSDACLSERREQRPPPLSALKRRQTTPRADGAASGATGVRLHCLSHGKSPEQRPERESRFRRTARAPLHARESSLGTCRSPALTRRPRNMTRGDWEKGPNGMDEGNGGEDTKLRGQPTRLISFGLSRLQRTRALAFRDPRWVSGGKLISARPL
ncbi:hypothetical protein HPB51_014496 [Rhipicephalus microplus]|uniref:Uncharacterized protein n=1 Tax=Rhipicephalus microplus TaxID=6941 RepID=A0A9J6EGT1_RHIMP|nr:hypothetical protein HPB51_014496 [Rhipicephalus microplus]